MWFTVSYHPPAAFLLRFFIRQRRAGLHVGRYLYTCTRMCRGGWVFVGGEYGCEGECVDEPARGRECSLVVVGVGVSVGVGGCEWPREHESVCSRE